MDYEIEWTDIAVEDYQRITHYLLANWTLHVKENFERIVNRKLSSLSFQPFRGIISPKYKNVRSILLTEHNRLYYEVGKNKITLLTIIDTRQNPIKNPFT